MRINPDKATRASKGRGGLLKKRLKKAWKGDKSGGSRKTEKGLTLSLSGCAQTANLRPKKITCSSGIDKETRKGHISIIPCFCLARGSSGEALLGPSLGTVRD